MNTSTSASGVGVVLPRLPFSTRDSTFVLLHPFLSYSFRNSWYFLMSLPFISGPVPPSVKNAWCISLGFAPISLSLIFMRCLDPLSQSDFHAPHNFISFMILVRDVRWSKWAPASGTGMPSGPAGYVRKPTLPFRGPSGVVPGKSDTYWPTMYPRCSILRSHSSIPEGSSVNRTRVGSGVRGSANCNAFSARFFAACCSWVSGACGRCLGIGAGGFRAGGFPAAFLGKVGFT